MARHETELELRLPSRVTARCDRERMAQIMRILLDNALRHTPEGTHVTEPLSNNGAASSRSPMTGQASPTSARSSSASIPATRSAAPASGWRLRANWPSA